VKPIASLLAVAAVAAVAALAACSSGEILFPNARNLAGMWVAWEFTVTDSTGTRDFAGGGNQFTLVLDPNGTVTGHLHLIGAGEGGADVDADMAGTWKLDHWTITFDQAADTFVRDTDFRFDQAYLRADFVSDGTTVHIRMIRA